MPIATIRGGGEFGERWHLDGNLTKKQNVFDDFAAAARHLIERKYTAPERLAIFGESNGGLLMGATLTQHPELMRAVVSRVGIYDMLRVELGAERRVQHHGIRHGEGRGAVQGALRLFALSPRHARHALSGGPADDRRERRPRRSDAFAQIRRVAAGGDRLAADQSCCA